MRSSRIAGRNRRDILANVDAPVWHGGCGIGLCCVCVAAGERRAAGAAAATLLSVSFLGVFAACLMISQILDEIT